MDQQRRANCRELVRRLEPVMKYKNWLGRIDLCVYPQQGLELLVELRNFVELHQMTVHCGHASSFLNIPEPFDRLFGLGVESNWPFDVASPCSVGLEFEQDAPTSMPPLRVINEIGFDRRLMVHVARVAVRFPRHARVASKLELLNLCIDAWGDIGTYPEHVIVPHAVLTEIDEPDGAMDVDPGWRRFRNLYLFEPIEGDPLLPDATFHFLFAGRTNSHIPTPILSNQ